MVTLSRLEAVCGLNSVCRSLRFCAERRRATEEVVTQQLRQCRAEQAVAGAGEEIATCGAWRWAQRIDSINIEEGGGIQDRVTVRCECGASITLPLGLKMIQRLDPDATFDFARHSVQSALVNSIDLRRIRINTRRILARQDRLHAIGESGGQFRSGDTRCDSPSHETSSDDPAESATARTPDAARFSVFLRGKAVH